MLPNGNRVVIRRGTELRSDVYLNLVVARSNIGSCYCESCSPFHWPNEGSDLCNIKTRIRNAKLINQIRSDMKQSITRISKKIWIQFSKIAKNAICPDGQRLNKVEHLSLWPSGIGSRLGRNRLWVRFLAGSDIYPMFIEPTITRVPSGFSGYIWLDTKIVLKNKARQVLWVHNYGLVQNLFEKNHTWQHEETFSRIERVRQQ